MRVIFMKREFSIAASLQSAPERLPISDQAFKWRFVATADRDASSLEISGAAIAAWVHDQLEVT